MKMSNKLRNLSLVIAGVLMTGLSGCSNAKPDQLRIGWTAWADADVVSLMAEKLIESHYEQPVERVMADIGIQYDSVARGNLDLMLMAWLPKTHDKYWQKVSDRVVDLGMMYSGRIGWVVPDYVPKQRIGSISDLSDPKIANDFNNTVQGIDPGSGLMQASEQALTAYDLSDLKLISASGAAMTAVLDRAINDDRWVVVTGWTPHWMFARYKLRFLKDPKSVFGGQEGIHAIARLGLDKDHPKVVAFFTRFKLSDGQLDVMLLDAQNTSTEEAVNNYIANNRNQIDYWMNGTMQEPKDREAKP
ncbi:glycine betaine ABC transporter substrate-binding protein [Prochlorococcus marinus]|uniref:glycine betaine ABC transporter substrate-binding protein n=1 Tax=Prochlorococcus TaxID=1218 RepID=UPI0007B3E421|nr:glycine betaine ABC transporter substrate-binding protein [Prochlorococcus marinus]KZR75298.1 Glycine betaine-binding protein OpuAC precursor [Prochlorococcus marinus str. MIT 1323]